MTSVKTRPMENFSNDELVFIRDGIVNGVRVDQRRSCDERHVVPIPSAISQSDGHIRLRRGLSEVDVSIQFKETSETLVALGLIEETSGPGEDVVETPVALPATVGNMISGFLSEHKVGVRIGFDVINDDGNVYDLFFAGLKALFLDVEMPVVEDLGRVKRSGLDIPVSRTFAVVDGSFVSDPTKIEEEASDGLVHVFVGSRKEIVGCFSEKNCCLGHDVFANILHAAAA